MTDPIQDYYDVDVAKLNALAMKSAARAEELKAENVKLRELVIRMRPICMQGKRCTFADKLYICKTIEELGIEVDA